jgi:general secretion pathway protein E
MRQAIHDKAGELDLERIARRSSPSILEDGWKKCLAGLTSAEEVMKVTREE